MRSFDGPLVPLGWPDREPETRRRVNLGHWATFNSRNEKKIGTILSVCAYKFEVYLIFFKKC